MSIIIPANSAVGGGYAVDNSCRFNDGSSDYLSRTPGSAGNRRTWTFSAWVKRSQIGDTYNNLFSAGTDSDTNGYVQIAFWGDSQDWLEVSIWNSSIYRFRTTQLFRDPSAWYHIVIAFDTTQGTNTNRIKFYVNGEQITSFATYNTLAQNFDSAVNNTEIQKVGAGSSSGSSVNNYFDGYMCEVVMIDGQQLTPTSFGEFDEDSGIWKPISVSGLTYGTNGFYLDFESSGSLGNDAVGSNNFTVNNLTAIDQTTDTPTNNFATLNSLAKGSGSTFAEGNLKVTTTISNYNSSIASIGATQGKWYWEMKLGNSGGSGGVTNYSMYGVTTNSPISVAEPPAQEGRKWTYVKTAYGANFRYNETGGSYVQVSYGSANSGNDIVMIALDLDNNFIYMGANGTWYNSGNPTSGASGTGAAPRALVAGNTYFPSFTTSYGTNLEVNFGNAPYAISSGNTDGNDRGNFEYAPPSGFLSLCTANLSEVLG